MGRQWLLAKRLVTGLKKSKTNTQAVREITIAAKMGGGDPAMNALLLVAKLICERTVGTVSKWLSANGWTVITSKIGYLPKIFPELSETERQEVGEFLQALEDNDDVHRVWAAVK